MSDFFDKKIEAVMDTQDEQKIKVGEKEYSQEELNNLVGLGEKSRELEEKWNTKIDTLMPDYTKKAQELAELRKQENEWLKGKMVEETKPELTPEQIDEEGAKKILKDKFKVVTDDDFETKFKQKYALERQVERLAEQLSTGEKEIDGSDGRPKFNRDEILDFMKQTNIPDPKIAYRVKYDAQLSEWQAKQMASAKKPGIFTSETSTAGGKQPPKVNVTKDNLMSVLAEALGD